MLTSTRFSFLTFPSNHTYQNQPNAHFFPDRSPLLFPCSHHQPATVPLVQSRLDGLLCGISFGGLSECSQYTDGITPSSYILADLSIVHERIPS